jgi:O-acetyl-ADP-ribose deacetylase (regulator of RNase III)
MNLILVDLEPEMVRCWRKEFLPFPEVEILCDNILALAHTAIVSPANSYGFMDGGIDAIYLDYFGIEIQTRVQDAISRRREGYLPVGSSVVVRINDPKIQYLVVAPTMLMPERIPAANCFFAMSAALRAATGIPGISHLYCPGLGTGVGGVPFEVAALEMANAYGKWKDVQPIKK